jgi:two-component system, OmpR family, KDP operon response regulator KdpE
MNPQPTVLVIDDEHQILRALKTILSAQQFHVITAMTGKQGLEQAQATPPDVIILDLTLPDMEGVDVCSRLRQFTQAPVIVLSVRDSQRDKVAALDHGADDYLTKPFGIDELLARIRVALRHSVQALGSAETVISNGSLKIDLARHTVQRGDEEIKLTATEYKLLTYLAANAGRVLTHQSILRHVWDDADSDHVEYLRVYIAQLRKKIEDNPEEPQMLLTEPGVGYRFMTGGRA